MSGQASSGIEREKSSRHRSVLGPIPCLFGWHNWGRPRAVNSVTLSGEKQDDGTWEHWTDDPSKKVAQSCRSCPQNRYRDDLDWELLSDIQRGNIRQDATATAQDGDAA